MSLDRWNERYRNGEPGNEEPAALLVENADGLGPGRALDLASGAGRNAIWLARRGWEVVAIDGATEAIRILGERAAGLRIDARVLDLEAGAPLPFDDESFDLVTILFYLHRPLFAEAKRVLRAGGTIIAAAKMSGTWKVAPGEMHEQFEEWEIVHEREDAIAEMVARKPGHFIHSKTR
jgi:SAM-dependent methyltransferase